MKIIGRVLWWSEKYNKGVIVDTGGNEFYFDASVVSLKKNQEIKKKCTVRFEVNRKFTECLCAQRVTLPASSKKKD